MHIYTTFKQSTSSNTQCYKYTHCKLTIWSTSWKKIIVKVKTLEHITWNSSHSKFNILHFLKVKQNICPKLNDISYHWTKARHPRAYIMRHLADSFFWQGKLFFCLGITFKRRKIYNQIALRDSALHDYVSFLCLLNSRDSRGRLQAPFPYRNLCKILQISPIFDG